MEAACEHDTIGTCNEMLNIEDNDHKEFTRIGDEYQVEIPSLIPRFVYISNTDKSEFCGKPFAPSETSDQYFSSEIDEASILLGLYIFGKDFVQIKKFVGYNVSSIYYGNKFYKSDGRLKWKFSRKAKKKRAVFGKTIFSGFRVEELLSRLFAHISQENRKSLMNVSKLFEEEKMSLAEFVSTIKDIAGIKCFVEAMSIGNGKKDLTRMMKRPRKKQPDLPGGKTCFSTLTPIEIINFLNANIFETRQTVLNEFFWEAVWPLLFAGGWHMEQPICYTSKKPPVFLVPGIKKYSIRMRLIKGVQYFDSILDILNKVSSDPSLLGLEPQNLQSDRSENNVNRMVTGFDGISILPMKKRHKTMVFPS